MKYIESNCFKKEDILNLYEENGWMNYVDNIDRTMEAINKSLYVYSCFDDEKLVGLLRAVGDGLTIIYIQDILVLPEYQGNGIGTKLLKDTLNRYESVYQKVLITDNTIKNYNFYKKQGLLAGTDNNLISFIKMNK